MSNINKERVGSTFDEFLELEGMLTEVTALAHKRVFAWQNHTDKVSKALEDEKDYSILVYAYEEHLRTGEKTHSLESVLKEFDLD